MQNSNDNVIEIDLLKLIKVLFQKLWIIVLCGVIAGSAAFGYTYGFVDPTYQASAKLYVNNSSLSLGSTSFSISTSTISAAQELVSTYIVILETRTTLNEIIEYANVQNLSAESLKNMISASAVDSTEIFEVTVTSNDPVLSERLANSIAKVLPDRIAEIVDGSSVRIVDYAITPTQRTSPSYTKNTLIGIIFGMFLAAAIIAVLEIFDTSIKDEGYLAQAYDIPVLAVIPDINNTKSDSYYTNYYKK